MKKTLTFLTFILIARHQSVFSQQSAPTIPVKQQTIVIPLPNGQSDTLLLDDGDQDKTFTRVENPPYYLGGDSAWTAALKRVFGANRSILKRDGENSIGTCELQFIVTYDGSVVDVAAITMKDSRLAKILIDFIKTGPKWHPAVQNKYAVKAYHRIKVDYPEPIAE
jgi:hypothetical protein